MKTYSDVQILLISFSSTWLVTHQWTLLFYFPDFLLPQFLAWKRNPSDSACGQSGGGTGHPLKEKIRWVWQVPNCPNVTNESDVLPYLWRQVWRGRCDRWRWTNRGTGYSCHLCTHFIIERLDVTPFNAEYCSETFLCFDKLLCFFFRINVCHQRYTGVRAGEADYLDEGEVHGAEKGRRFGLRQHPLQLPCSAPNESF